MNKLTIILYDFPRDFEYYKRDYIVESIKTWEIFLPNIKFEHILVNNDRIKSSSKFTQYMYSKYKESERKINYSKVSYGLRFEDLYERENCLFISTDYFLTINTTSLLLKAIEDNDFFVSTDMKVVYTKTKNNPKIKELIEYFNNNPEEADELNCLVDLPFEKINLDNFISRTIHFASRDKSLEILKFDFEELPFEHDMFSLPSESEKYVLSIFNKEGTNVKIVKKLEEANKKAIHLCFF